MFTRRQMLQRSSAVVTALGGLGLLPQAAQAAFNAPAFEAKTMADLVKALGVSMPTESKDVTIIGPDIAENGAVVPVDVASNIPNTISLAVLVDKNPAPLTSAFDFANGALPEMALRVKMGQTSLVEAIAKTADGKYYIAKKEVKVTVGGCGG